MYLVRRDNDGLIVSHVAGHQLAEEGLGRNVETIGGFVHEQHATLRGKGKAYEHTLLLAQREFVEVRVHVDLEILQTLPENLLTEARIERLAIFHIACEWHRGQTEFVGHKENFLLQRRLAQARLLTIDEDAALARHEESAEQVQQGALAHSVLAEQTENLTFVERQCQSVEDILGCSRVLVTEILNLDHNFKCWRQWG